VYQALQVGSTSTAPRLPLRPRWTGIAPSCGPALPLLLSATCSAGSRSRSRVDPKVLARKWMPTAAVRSAFVGQVLGVGDKLQMLGVPAGVDAAAVMELLALWDRAAKELPAQSVGVTVLCLGDTPVWRGDPREPPAGSQLRMGWLEDGTVEQAFQLRTASSGLSAVGLLAQCRLPGRGADLL
jgi:hypothetical protein